VDDSGERRRAVGFRKGKQMERDFPGANELLDWFGEFPSFHDAEIEELLLSRGGTSRIKLSTCRTLPAVDENGRNKRDRRAVVSIEMQDVLDLELSDFSHQNVVASIGFERTGDAFRVSISPLFGIGGWVQARRIRFSVSPLHEA
jgi:hypothetical protein